MPVRCKKGATFSVDSYINAGRADPVNGIFLLYGGLPQTVMESQVFAHVQAMQKLGILMEVWTFAMTSQSFLHAESERFRLSEEYGVAVRVLKGVRPGIPFSPWVNAWLLAFGMFRNQRFPNFIHARTEYAAVVAAIVKRISPVRVVWDARGDTLSEYIEIVKRISFPWRLLAKLRVMQIKRRLRTAANQCDAAIFVSNQLFKLQGGGVPVERTIVVPCLADENLFYFSHIVREKARKELGYKDSDIVVIYVGSTAPWQCVSETVALMEKAMRCNPLVKALVITSDKNKFESLFADDVNDRVLIKTVALKKVNLYLNAADYGLMLREHSPINFVASPVKFAEYSLSGLTVVTTTAIDQVNTFGSDLGNTISPELFISEINGVNRNDKNRQTISSHAKDIMSRGAKTYISSIYRCYLGTKWK